MRQILAVVTSHAQLGNTGCGTGLWAEELSAPWAELREAGYGLDIATRDGSPVALDPASTKAGVVESVAALCNDPAMAAKLRNPIAGCDAAPGAYMKYDGLLIPGGFGALWDLSGCTEVAKMAETMLAAGKPVCAICSGVAGLLAAKAPDGRPLVAGRKVTSITDSELTAAGMAGMLPFKIEQRLRELGAIFVSRANFRPFAVRDGLLVTAQNPASSALAGQELVAALAQREMAAA